jgi:hypothetical protein
MTTPACPAPQGPDLPRPVLIDQLWPELRPVPRPRLVGAALVVGLAAAAVLPDSAPGLGWFLVLLAAGGVVVWSDERRAAPLHLAAALLATALLSPMVLLDAGWVVALCLLAAVAVGVATLVDARSVGGIVAAGVALPLASLRGLPWLTRSVVVTRRARGWWPVLRTAGVSVALVVVFGLLFASADAVFSAWAATLVPDLSADWIVVRGFVVVLVTGMTLCAAYLALNPPRVEQLAVPPGRPVRRTFEWLVPLSLVVAVFAAFVLAQAAALFGGHEYVQRTTGLTYAQYVHQGFGQLTVATLLTLAVVAAAARKAARSAASERLLLRLVLGSLCLLTLVVVGSALHRMQLYEQAYGFTRLRLLVSVFEGWLGLLVVLVMSTGVRLQGWWVPRAALLTGAVAVLALAAVNPDAYIARANLDRLDRTGEVDAAYLSGLSADAAPALAGHPAGTEACASGSGRDSGGLSWNLSRRRAGDLGCP